MDSETISDYTMYVKQKPSILLVLFPQKHSFHQLLNGNTNSKLQIHKKEVFETRTLMESIFYNRKVLGNSDKFKECCLDPNNALSFTFVEGVTS